MANTSWIEVKQEVLSRNTEMANGFRSQRAAGGTLAVDVLGSPGAGKTTFLLALAEHLRKTKQAQIGVIEADLESDVDALKIKQSGIPSVELNTKGLCHVEMGMMQQAFDAFRSTDFDYLFLENIGNLVCPAEFDTGCHLRIMLLSIPEGYDKVYKYPPMFSIVDALVVTKLDYLPLNPDFDMTALRDGARFLNPNLKIFEVSARTREGIDVVATWLSEKRQQILADRNELKGYGNVH